MSTTPRNERGGGFTLVTAFPQVDSIGDGFSYVFDHADLATDVMPVKVVNTNGAETFFDVGFMRNYTYTVTAYYRRTNDGQVSQIRPADTGSGTTVEEPFDPGPEKLPLDVLAAADGLTGFLLSQPPYDLEVGALAEIRQSFRRRQITNPHVQGTYTINAERENIEVPVNVWCDGPSAAEARAQVRKLEDLFGRRTFTLQLFFNGPDREDWTCEVSDYAIEQTRDWRFANMALVKASVVVRNRKVVQT